VKHQTSGNLAPSEDPQEDREVESECSDPPLGLFLISKWEGGTGNVKLVALFK